MLRNTTSSHCLARRAECRGAGFGLAEARPVPPHLADLLCVELDLYEEQYQKFRKVIPMQMQEMSKFERQIRETMPRIYEKMEQPHHHSLVAFALTDTIVVVRLQLGRTRLRHFLELEALLSPEQQVRFG